MTPVWTSHPITPDPCLSLVCWSPESQGLQVLRDLLGGGLDRWRLQRRSRLGSPTSPPEVPPCSHQVCLLKEAWVLCLGTCLHRGEGDPRTYPLHHLSTSSGYRKCTCLHSPVLQLGSAQIPMVSTPHEDLDACRADSPRAALIPSPPAPHKGNRH